MSLFLPRNGRQRVMRGALGLAVLATPLIGDWLPLAMIPIAAAVLIAYDGLDAPGVMITLVSLIVAELLWGVGFGVWSCSYLFAALVAGVAERFISLTPFRRERGWAIASFLRAVIAGTAWAVVVGMSSVVIQSWFFGQGSLGILMHSLYQPWPHTLAIIAGLVAAGIIVLHRIDVPFRRSVVFAG